MFSVEEKIRIARVIENVLLALNHPEMPKEKPNFKLHVDGEKEWSFADIEPNWKVKDKYTNANQWNEVAREVLK